MPSKKPPATPAPTPLEVASLAARFLPQIDLAGIGPKEKEAWHPDMIKAAIGELTSGKGRNYSKDYEFPEAWATPFEIIAEEAVKRARCLLDAAAGIVRPARLEFAHKSKAATDAFRKLNEHYEEMRRSGFPRLAKGRAEIPILEVLNFALPRSYAHNPENVFDYWRTSLSESVRERRAKLKLPEISVTFADIATEAEKANKVEAESDKGPPSCVILPHGRDYQVGLFEFPPLVLNLRDFYNRNAGALQKKRQRTGGKKGGEKAQASLQKEAPGVLAEAWSFGSSRRAKKM